MTKQKIVSIEIELVDYEPIKFTMKEAKELYEQLDALFGDKQVERHYHYPWWNRPYYYWTNAAGGQISTTNITSVSLSELANTAVQSTDTQMKVTYNA